MLRQREPLCREHQGEFAQDIRTPQSLYYYLGAKQTPTSNFDFFDPIWGQSCLWGLSYAQTHLISPMRQPKITNFTPKPSWISSVLFLHRGFDARNPVLERIWITLLHVRSIVVPAVVTVISEMSKIGNHAFNDLAMDQ